MSASVTYGVLTRPVLSSPIVASRSRTSWTKFYLRAYDRPNDRAPIPCPSLPRRSRTAAIAERAGVGQPGIGMRYDHAEAAGADRSGEGTTLQALLPKGLNSSPGPKP